MILGPSVHFDPLDGSPTVTVIVPTRDMCERLAWDVVSRLPGNLAAYATPEGPRWRAVISLAGLTCTTIKDAVGAALERACVILRERDDTPVT